MLLAQAATGAAGLTARPARAVGLGAAPEQGKELLSPRQAQGCSSHSPFPREWGGQRVGVPGVLPAGIAQLHERFKLRNARALVLAEGAEKWESVLSFLGLGVGEVPPDLAHSSSSSPPAWGGLGTAAAQGPPLGSRQLRWGESEPKPTWVLPGGGWWVRLSGQPLAWAVQHFD